MEETEVFGFLVEKALGIFAAFVLSLAVYFPVGVRETLERIVLIVFSGFSFTYGIQIFWGGVATPIHVASATVTAASLAWGFVALLQNIMRNHTVEEFLGFIIVKPKQLLHTLTHDDNKDKDKDKEK